MGLITKEVEINLQGCKYVKYYEDLGYKIPRKYSKSHDKYVLDYSVPFIVKTEDLKNNSKVKVDVECCICNKQYNIYYNAYQRNIKRNNGEYHCINCGAYLRGKNKTRSYKYSVGEIVNKLEIVNIIYGVGEKRYNVKCSKDKYEFPMLETDISNGYGCPVCANKICIKGINDIATTHPHLVKYFVDIEDAYTHTYGSCCKCLFVCPNCFNKKRMTINKLVKAKKLTCNKCSDGFSYPEKLMTNILSQLNIEFITQLSSKNFKWCNNYRYDFYLPDYNCIIETHGSQHYDKHGFGKIGGRTLEEEQENDKNKKELALSNGIKEENYIIIDCRKSELDFIKYNIIHSRLNDLFDLNNINWYEIEENSQKSIVKELCTYWHIHREINNEDITTTTLSEIFNIEQTTILKYLHIGTNLNWCNYNGYEEHKRISTKTLIEANKNRKKKIEIFKDEVSLGVYESVCELARISEKDFGVKLFENNIRKAVNGRAKTHKGFTFKFVEK